MTRQSNCPGCRASVILTGRVFCRPSCKAKHEHQERQQRPSLFTGLTVLDSAWPSESKPTADRSGPVNPTAREVPNPTAPEVP